MFYFYLKKKHVYEIFWKKGLKFFIRIPSVFVTPKSLRTTDRGNGEFTP